MGKITDNNTDKIPSPQREGAGNIMRRKMMKSGVRILFILILAILPLSLSAEGAKDELKLKKIADDIKFQNGLQFYTLGMEHKALEEFKEYLEIFINGTHRKEAHSYIAKIYFDRQEYPLSIKANRSLFEEYSHSEEGIEAYFQIGLCYQKMGNNRKAGEIFNTIIRDYPDSNYAYRARIYSDIAEILKNN
jgi:TolA-binding protein